VFLGLLLVEALLGLYVYQRTGEISTFLIVIMVFLVYACTFGIFDFIKLDRWMRDKIGNFRGVYLLSEKERWIIKRHSDQKYVGNKYRPSSILHFVIFVIAQSIFLSMGSDSFAEAKEYLLDISWVETVHGDISPDQQVLFHVKGIFWGMV